MSAATKERTRTVPRKRQLAEGEPLSEQIGIRLTPTFRDRINRAALALGTDETNLVRMILSESLPSYEDRAARAQRPTAKGGKLG